MLHPGPWCVWELGLHLPVVTLQEGFIRFRFRTSVLFSEQGSCWTEKEDTGSSFLLNLALGSEDRRFPSLGTEGQGQLTPSGPCLASTCWDHQVTGPEQGLGRTGGLEDRAV